MRPIDTIKNKIDSDFRKYHATTLCKIDSDFDIKSIKGIGLVALVHPLNVYQQDDPLSTGDEHKFLVNIVNSTPKNMGTNIYEKYNVLVLNSVSDRAEMGVGILVSKTILPDVDTFQKADSLSLTSMTKEYIMSGV
jgi:hypothetical protein